jgi:hypothetical protein
MQGGGGGFANVFFIFAQKTQKLCEVLSHFFKYQYDSCSFFSEKYSILNHSLEFLCSSVPVKNSIFSFLCKFRK